jgi:cyclic beta-1,2-glucan glucanotransferase
MNKPDLWSPTAAPIRNQGGTYIARHGRGYGCSERAAHAIALELRQFVPLDDPINISRFTLRNTSGRTRHIFHIFR